MAESNTLTIEKETKHSESSTPVCGCGPFKLSWANRFSNPQLFTLHSGVLMGVNIMTNTYLGGVLSTIERSFKISSAASGTLAIINDVVQLSLVFVVAYFAHSAHRPRVIAVGTILLGMAQFLCTVPHYVSPPRDPASVIYGSDNLPSGGFSGSGFCISNQFLSNDTGACGGKTDHQGFTSGPIIWLIVGRIVAGIGAS